MVAPTEFDAATGCSGVRLPAWLHPLLAACGNWVQQAAPTGVDAPPSRAFLDSFQNED